MEYNINHSTYKYYSVRFTYLLYLITILVITVTCYSQDKPFADDQTSNFNTALNNAAGKYSLSTSKQTFRFVRFEKESVRNRLRENMFMNDVNLSIISISQIKKFSTGKVADFPHSFTNNYNTGITISFDLLSIFK